MNATAQTTAATQVEELSQADLSQILELQERVVSHLPDRRFLTRRSRADLERVLADGFVLGIRRHDRLVAYHCLERGIALADYHYLPRSLRTLAPGQGLQGRGVAVDPEFQGHGLYGALLRARAGLARRAGFHYVSGIVYPHNLPALRAQFGAGCQIAGLYFDEDGWNFAHFQVLDAKLETRHADSAAAEASVDIADFRRHRHNLLLRRRGVALESGAKGPLVRYAGAVWRGDGITASPTNIAREEIPPT